MAATASEGSGQYSELSDGFPGCRTLPDSTSQRDIEAVARAAAPSLIGCLCVGVRLQGTDVPATEVLLSIGSERCLAEIA
jgi:hypothetical protein